MRILILVFVANLIVSLPTLAQESKIALPTVAGAEVPLYPPIAWATHIEGDVHIKITTDGHAVVESHFQDGHLLLAQSAEENVRTWRFVTHTPVSFTVTYHYRLSTKFGDQPENPTVILKFPTEVEIIRYPMSSGY